MRISNKTQIVLTASAVIAALAVPGVRAQEWTLEKDQVVEEPEPYSP